MLFSVIIPVYNRPEEVKELLQSFLTQSFSSYEIIVVEDGSAFTCEGICEAFRGSLPIRYVYKANGGPSSARNAGASYAEGEYLLFLDSDTILPAGYLKCIADYIGTYSPDLFGGPDRAAESFTPLQKAISYSMTSFFTTGGIRGSSKRLTKFIPRSFNMGVKLEVFEKVGGFSNMRFGEDMDFSMRVMQAGYRSCLIDSAFLYHKRRSGIKSFYKQVLNSGRARIELSVRHKGTLKLIHLMPLFFVLGCCGLIIGSFLVKSIWPMIPIFAYALMIFIDSSIKEKSPRVGLLSIVTSFVQLFGYGIGLMDNFWKRCVLKKSAVSNIDNDRFYS